jgi:hypothetical protein
MSTSLNDLAALLKSMASRPEYHFPIVAAQRQYRERYYGLSSAAMLEDLFLDAIVHFVSTHRPDVKIERPPRGEKGWDYSFDDLKMSHKVSSSGPPDIAVLWDATKTNLTHYTYKSPISLTTGGYSPNSVRLSTPTGEEFMGKPAKRDAQVRFGSSLVLLRWPEGESGQVLFRWVSDRPGAVQDVFGFRQIWAEVARAFAQDIPANHLELLLLSGNADELEPRTTIRVSSTYRPGTFLIADTALVDLPVKTNNRAVLIDKKIIAKLMATSAVHELFIPMPIWFAAYAGDRPPDLYLSQKRSFDDSFSSGVN